MGVTFSSTPGRRVSILHCGRAFWTEFTEGEHRNRLTLTEPEEIEAMRAYISINRNAPIREEATNEKTGCNS